MIVGAGSAASWAVNLCKAKTNFGNPVILVDDDPNKKNMRVQGVPVRGTLDDIPELARRYHIREIVIAIPSLKGERLNQVVDLCHSTHCRVRMLSCLLYTSTKGIPLAHEMARQSGKRYVVARKGEKLYMPKPVVVTDKSITTAGEQKLVVDQAELDAMNGKRVLIVDDVISTGGSMHALEALVAHSQCHVVAEAAVLAEGDAAKRKDIIFLAPLPLFFH